MVEIKPIAADVLQSREVIKWGHGAVDVHDDTGRHGASDPGANQGVPIVLRHHRQCIRQGRRAKREEDTDLRCIPRRRSSHSDLLQRGQRLPCRRVLLVLSLDTSSERPQHRFRHDPPRRITGTVGNRPKKPQAIRTWDTALGYLDQHQTARNLTAGLGNARQPGVTRAFLHSRALAARIAREPIEIRNREQAITRSPVMRIR